MDKSSPNTIEAIPENLLRCLQRGMELDFLKEFRSEDWDVLVEQAGRYTLGPFLYQRLVRDCQGQNLVPSETEQILRQSYLGTLAQNMVAYHLLGQVLERLQQAGIRVLLLKGAYLAEQVYGDIGLRPMGDLDLLVPADELQRGLSILKEMGFTAEREYSDEADGDLHFHAPAMTKDEIVIELHWDLVVPSSPVQIDIQGLWQRAKPITLENGQAWTLGLEDLLLYLSVHAAYGHEYNNQLRSLVDISEVIHHFVQELNWMSIKETAIQWGANRGVYLTLDLAWELMNAEVPIEKLESMKPTDWTPHALGWARQRLFREEQNMSASYLRLMDEELPFSERSHALLYGLFPPRVVMTRLFGYPSGSWQITVRYLTYAASRIGQYWGLFWRRLRGDLRQEKESQSALALKGWLRIED